LIEYNGLKLDPFQEEAIRRIDEGCSVLVSAPTGSGKTLIAEYALEKALREGTHIIYTAPIKALSNQKFRDFQKRWGSHIGLVTGDLSINPDSPAVIMTTEIFRNSIFDSPHRLDKVSHVIFDEIHYLDDDERGTVWEESIIFAPQHIKLIALSATIPNINQVVHWISSVRKSPLIVLHEPCRPVPLKHLLWMEHFGVANCKDLKQLEKGFDKSRRGKETLIDHLVKENRLPCLYFIFNRKGCEEQAERYSHRSLLTTDEQVRIIELFNRLCAQYELEPEKIRQLSQLVSCGVAYHHAGMLPTMKEVVEQLFTSGLIKLLFATETFAVGVNMPAKSVVFDEITKFDGIRRNFIRSRDYHQMAGRAGRRGIDPVGYAYLRLPPYGARASIIERITDEANIEEIKSQFNLSYSCILNLYHTLKENIYQAAQKSLSNYQAVRGKQKKASHFHQQRYNNVIDQLRRKIGLLNRMGYIHGQTLTEKGHIAKQVYSFELSLTEFIIQGVFNQLNSDQINLLLVALVYESKRRDWGKKFNYQIIRSIQKPALPIISRLLDEERKNGILPTVRLLDFKLASATYAWSTGAPFDDIINHTSVVDGDIIRTFRLAIQLVRQMLRLGRHNKWGQPLMDKFYSCFNKMSRDEVDAEKQLRQSAE